MTTNTRKTKQVIVMRKDLKMRRGKQIAQGAHAAVQAVLSIMSERVGSEFSSVPLPDYHNALNEWLQGNHAKICVSVNSEDELYDIFNKAFDAGLPVQMIVDSGLTEFKGVHTRTCLAIGPAWADDIDKITGELPLL